MSFEYVSDSPVAESFYLIPVQKKMGRPVPVKWAESSRIEKWAESSGPRSPGPK